MAFSALWLSERSWRAASSPSMIQAQKCSLANADNRVLMSRLCECLTGPQPFSPSSNPKLNTPARQYWEALSMSLGAPLFLTSSGWAFPWGDCSSAKRPTWAIWMQYLSSFFVRQWRVSSGIIDRYPKLSSRGSMVR